MPQEQRNIEEATRLSLQIRRVSESGESSSSASVRPTHHITRSTVVTTFEQDDDFQEPIALQPRTSPTAPSTNAPVQAPTQSTGMPMKIELHF